MTRSERAPSQRRLRMGETVRHRLAEIMLRASFRDPQLQGLDLVTISEVEMTADLRDATVFVSVLGRADADETVRALDRAAGYFRGELGRSLDAKFTPRLRFRRDPSFGEADRVETLIRENRNAR